MCPIGVSWLMKNKCVEEARIGVGCRSLKRLANCSNHHSPGAKSFNNNSTIAAGVQPLFTFTYILHVAD